MTWIQQAKEGLRHHLAEVAKSHASLEQEAKEGRELKLAVLAYFGARDPIEKLKARDRMHVLATGESHD